MTDKPDTVPKNGMVYPNRAIETIPYKRDNGVEWLDTFGENVGSVCPLKGCYARDRHNQIGRLRRNCVLSYSAEPCERIFSFSSAIAKPACHVTI